MINLYLFVFYILGIFWLIFGLYSIFNIIKLGIDGKLISILNGRDNVNRNINNDINNKNNRIDDEGEIHQLITINK